MALKYAVEIEIPAHWEKGYLTEVSEELIYVWEVVGITFKVIEIDGFSKSYTKGRLA